MNTNKQNQPFKISSFQMINSSYLKLRLRIIFMLFQKHKLTIKKGLNLLICYLSYYLKLTRSSRFPFAISFDLSNECNANCIFCRTAKGEIYNQNPKSEQFIAKGFMSFDIFAQIINETKNHLLMAILYVNGEPFIYKQLGDAVSYATKNNVATMIATNGILLNEKNMEMLLAAGIDFIKVAISGFTQVSYSRQNRHGDVEKIKQNLLKLHEMNNRLGNKTIIMIDFMFYEYNMDEIVPAKAFFENLGFMFNLRRGNTRYSDSTNQSPTQKTPDTIPVCDWPWKTLTINWNGDVFPCCDYVVWSDMPAYKKLQSGDINIKELWNGSIAQKYRELHLKNGRKAIPICADCTRSKITFKD